MAKDKERSVNPALAQRKLEKQKALKKSRVEQQARRNEKLARRNPARIERQIKDLKAAQEAGQQLRTHDKQRLEELERDLRAVQKAREALGERAPKFDRDGHHRDEQSTLGKRRRDDFRRRGKHDDSSDTDEDVRNIPMPRDPSPPLPREYWDRRRQRRGAKEREEGKEPENTPKPEKPQDVDKVVYEAAPQIRDLRKEAVSRFVPAAVRQKQQNLTAAGRLLEPEEMDKLEKAGYIPKAQSETSPTPGPSGPQVVDPAKPADEAVDKANQVQVEEVEDEYDQL